MCFSNEFPMISGDQHVTWPATVAPRQVALHINTLQCLRRHRQLMALATAKGALESSTVLDDFRTNQLPVYNQELLHTYYITTLKIKEGQFSGEPVPWTKPGMSFIRWDLPRQHKQPITKESKISICSIHCQWTSMLNWYILVLVRLEKTFQSKSQGINNQHMFWHSLR